MRNLRIFRKFLMSAQKAISVADNYKMPEMMQLESLPIKRGTAVKGRWRVVKGRSLKGYPFQKHYHNFPYRARCRYEPRFDSTNPFRLLYLKKKKQLTKKANCILSPKYEFYATNGYTEFKTISRQNILLVSSSSCSFNNHQRRYTISYSIKLRVWEKAFSF